MAKDYFKVEPDYTRLMQKHYNTGRAGQKIEFIVRHHAAGVLTTDQMWQVWQSRQASAHYNIEVSGRVGQLVYDNNTAWATGSTRGNQRGISIEHSNSAGAGQDWPIADATIDEGARWAAALCHFYKLGRPQYGRNIFDHRDFYATSCGYHLANGGRYHARWMTVAQEHFDWMAQGGPTEQGGISVSEADRIIEFIQAYLGPNNSDTKDIRFQLTGSRDMIPGDPQASYPGFEQLGQNSEGANLTVTDALAAVRRDIANLGKRLDRIEGK